MKKAYRFLALVLLLICSVAVMSMTVVTVVAADKPNVVVENGDEEIVEITWFKDGSFMVTTLTQETLDVPDGVVFPPDDADPAKYPEEYPEFCKFVNQSRAESGLEPAYPSLKED